MAAKKKQEDPNIASMTVTLIVPMPTSEVAKQLHEYMVPNANPQKEFHLNCPVYVTELQLNYFPPVPRSFEPAFTVPKSNLDNIKEMLPSLSPTELYELISAIGTDLQSRKEREDDY